MGNGSNRRRATRAANAAGGRFIGAGTAAAFNRQRNRGGSLTDRISRARTTLRRARPRARVR